MSISIIYLIIPFFCDQLMISIGQQVYCMQCVFERKKAYFVDVRKRFSLLADVSMSVSRKCY